MPQEHCELPQPFKIPDIRLMLASQRFSLLGELNFGNKLAPEKTFHEECDRGTAYQSRYKKKIVCNDKRCGEVTMHCRYVIGNEDDKTRDDRWYEKKSEEPKIEHQYKNDS